MYPYSVYLYHLTQTVLRDRNIGVPNALLLKGKIFYIIILHRRIADGYSKTRKDDVSLHKWLENAHFAKVLTNALKNSPSDIF